MKLHELQQKAKIMLSYTNVLQLTFNKNIPVEIQVNIGKFFSHTPNNNKYSIENKEFQVSI